MRRSFKTARIEVAAILRPFALSARLKGWYGPLLRLRAEGAARRTVRKLLMQIEADGESLRRFGSESDREFTELAARLQNLDTRLAKLKLGASQLDLALKGQDDDRALASASEVYRRAVDLVHSSMGIALSEEEQMGELEKGLLLDRGAFARNNQVIRSLVTLIRIETARIDSESYAVFAHVASEISLMVKRMEEIAGSAFAQLENVVTQGLEDRWRLQVLEEELSKRAGVSMSGLSVELARVKAALVPCAEHSEAISELLMSAKAATVDVSTALQYQDIVRQQLEHVSVGFKEIHDYARSSTAGGAGSAGRQLDLSYVNHAIRVQLSHLRSSRQSIERAGAEVKRGMEGLLATGEELIRRFGAMEATADTAFRDCQMASLLKKETATLVDIAQESEMSNERVRTMVSEVEEFAKVFSRDIGRQEYEVKLIALNAQIAAARLTSAGALSCLATEISRVSDETAALTSEMSEALRSTIEQLLKVKNETNVSRQNLGEERQRLGAETEAVAQRLERLNAGVQHNAGRFSGEYLEAHSEVKALLLSLKFPDLIGECYGPAEALCEELLQATDVFAKEGGLGAEARVRLDAHKDRYTMVEERQVHAAALTDVQGGAVAVEAAGEGAVSGKPAPVEGDARAGDFSVNRTLSALGEGAGGSLEASTPGTDLGVEFF